MGLEISLELINLPIVENIKKTLSMEQANTRGLMGRNIKENGTKAKCMGLVN